MTRGGRSLVEMAARLLAAEEREPVLGDLAEAQASAREGVLEIFGLVIRRQAALWCDWRPWLAAFGVALPGTLLLEGVSLSVSCTFQRLSGVAVYGWCSRTGQEGVPLLLCHILLLLAWSWTSGFVVGSLSRRTLWVSAAVALCPCVFCLASFREASVSRLCLLLFAPPAILGICHGLRLIRVKASMAVVTAVIVTALMLCAWMNEALWKLNWALIWPAWFMAWSGGKVWLRSSDYR